VCILGVGISQTNKATTHTHVDRRSSLKTDDSLSLSASGPPIPQALIRVNKQAEQKPVTAVVVVVGAKKENNNNLENIKTACKHNAKICKEFKQFEKARVWELLALVSSENSQQDECDGWGQPCDSALSRKLVTRLIEFYERNGDVQMLATMVCVLSGGERVRDVAPEEGDGINEGDVDNTFSLLQVNQNEKFDRYIVHYAQLLYLASERSERSVRTLEGPPGQLRTRRRGHH